MYPTHPQPLPSREDPIYVSDSTQKASRPTIPSGQNQE